MSLLEVIGLLGLKRSIQFAIIFSLSIFVFASANALVTTSTTITPNPSSVTVGNTITFTATVTDTSTTPTAPTGIVQWGDGLNGNGGIFSPSPNPPPFVGINGTCTLLPINGISSSCQVTYTAPLTAGVVLINGLYSTFGAPVSSVGFSTLTVSSLTSAQATTKLIDTIKNMGLSHGLTSSLTATLKSINLTNIPSACGKLGAFINQVNTDLANGQLTSSQATTLLNQVNAIKTSIGC